MEALDNGWNLLKLPEISNAFFGLYSLKLLTCIVQQVGGGFRMKLVVLKCVTSRVKGSSEATDVTE
jgi:hypothetical protein